MSANLVQSRRKCGANGVNATFALDLHGFSNRGANVAFTPFAPQIWTRFAHIFTAQIWCKSVFSFSEFKVSQDERLLSLLARIDCSSRYINYTFSLLNF